MTATSSHATTVIMSMHKRDMLAKLDQDHADRVSRCVMLHSLYLQARAQTTRDYWRARELAALQAGSVLTSGEQAMLDAAELRFIEVHC